MSGGRGGWLVLWMMLGALATGCGSRDFRTLETSLPSEVRQDYDVFVANCGKCHSLARPLNAPIREVAHWDLYVAKMMRTPGSGISKREAPAILRFLYFYTREKEARRRRQDGTGQEPADEVSESAKEEQP